MNATGNRRNLILYQTRSLLCSTVGVHGVPFAMCGAER